MDELAEDDIDILNHEKADTHHKRDGEIPIPMYTGEESVASHFALVTAYEDIKKRLKETERDNSLLKKRVKWLEEKLLGSRVEETTSSVGPEQVNKAYEAYREACIERDNLKSKLDKMMKESTESLKLMNEQLQSKEVELLQLKTEVETQQVMKSLTCNPSSWEIDKLNNALKVHSLETDLEKLREECNDLRKELKKSIWKAHSHEGTLLNGEFLQPENIHSESLQQAYWELKREMSNLHLVTEVQAEVLRKLKLIPSATKKVSSCAPVQCIEDLENFAASSAAFKKRLLVPNEQVFSSAVSSPSCTDERLSPVCNSPFQEHNSYGKSSLEDNSWVFPSPPKPSETMFWEMKSKMSHLNFSENSLDQCNQNCLHKS
ncbi:PREDICTED: 5-azacytidine-induced protein 2 [Gekko japonicus]|uniref:5-azacytidine-induced protein 2 n=1 Tax=Gekko japonicus TaxID=146911 RepID=A0ABM1KBF8_GEKJA|nr:PREDICTED: 5-azacytidine-induced protein 2 [Gekko japonicus]XP_015271044.1 PREDICTED: 5-azacytidine-induced protein 2 [Gekko japonicus]XP_015271045.1 PREDICTED: 5-azacytidine-induced protein 2 [Gekko japonicus]